MCVYFSLVLNLPLGAVHCTLIHFTLLHLSLLKLYCVYILYPVAILQYPLVVFPLYVGLNCTMAYFPCTLVHFAMYCGLLSSVHIGMR